MGPGKVQAIRLGYKTAWFADNYHRALTAPWWVFLIVGMAAYLGLNLVFAELYVLEPGAIEHARPGVFADAFFFSIQTMATIGYGVLTPAGTYGNIVVTAETMVSLVFIAVATGMTFARFSRPTARVMFSMRMTVAPYNGVETLQVRLANGRRNQILRNERSTEGLTMRRFHDLRLLRDHTPIFMMTFTVMHPIDADSPLHGATRESLAAGNAELLVTVTGLDER